MQQIKGKREVNLFERKITIMKHNKEKLISNLL